MPSLSVAKPDTAVTIDQPRRIRFTWASINRFEEVYGMSISDSLVKNVGARFVTHLAWAGLLHAEPGLSIREVERRLGIFVRNDGDINALSEALLGALVDSGVVGKPRNATDPEPEPEAAEVPPVDPPETPES